MARSEGSRCQARLVYGVFDTDAPARAELERIGEALAANRPLVITQRSGHTFLVPARRVHYAVMAEVIRPKDGKILDYLDRPDYAG